MLVGYINHGDNNMSASDYAGAPASPVRGHPVDCAEETLIKAHPSTTQSIIRNFVEVQCLNDRSTGVADRR
jgi:hypothetical protein